MKDFAFEWVTCDGGPLLLLPEKYLAFWEGSLEPAKGRVVEARFRWNLDGAATDYDRACDVGELLGVIEVGEGHGVVLAGDEPFMTTWLPSATEHGGMFVRWDYGENEADLIEFATSFPETYFHDDPVSITVEDSDLILFPACESAPFDIYPLLRINLVNGRYKFSTLYVSNRFVSAICHRLNKIV